MIQKVFGVRDSKAMAFLQPFFSASTGAAVRAFADTINEGNNQLSKHPEDYLLFELGEFDDNSGEFTRTGPNKMLGCGADFVVPKGRGMDPKYFETLSVGVSKGKEVVDNGSQK